MIEFGFYWSALLSAVGQLCWPPRYQFGSAALQSSVRPKEEQLAGACSSHTELLEPEMQA